MLDPFVILSIGVVVVIGMIIVLRVNAFIALITAAMVVSLLSPGALGEKVSRVASAFGGVCGSIGIVIALAAVIGKCLMDSGAADRIVRCFLAILGEKRSSVSLTLSGFVLSIPVFFDTVFYLLVPLARALFKRTKKNYLLYVTAIVAGAAVTHTLVPPTPGPLFVANRLNIDIGLMIMVGCMVGLPTAIVGLLCCGLMNRLMEVPMRPYSGEPEPEPLEDDQLPPLWLSLLPVILPVLMISANTVMTMYADAEHAALFQPGDVRDWPATSVTLVGDADAEPNSAATHLMQQLPDSVQQAMREAAQGGSLTDQQQQEAIAALNGVLGDRKFYDETIFSGVTLTAPAKALLGKDLGRLSQAQVERFNRIVLETAFSEAIRPHVWDTSRREASYVTAVLGDPNLALLLSAAIAMIVLVRYRKLSFKELAKTTETALMSGGVIILITAGGGAFGGMLQKAGVREAVEGMMTTEGQGMGVTILLGSFLLASMLKVAQGSSTVSMIATSSMVAAMGVTSETTGCSLAYLAAVIGSGSLVGSWMNDSGFWIFARMSGLTEAEALKSWTILLIIIGCVGLGFALLFSRVLPLV